MLWLGTKRGYLTDWMTQRWVQATGRRIDLERELWLDGPIAPTTGIGLDYFSWLAESRGLRVHSRADAGGILPVFTELRGVTFDPSRVHPGVRRFYEQTAAYELDAWAHWCGWFRPFGWLLAVIFSRRLQQLNVPLSGLDTSKGVTSEVLQLSAPGTFTPAYTAWYRRLSGTGNVLYAGFYSVCALPGRPDPCVKVVFPLPNGNAIVIMRTESRPDGSFAVISSGKGFGDPGFYFTVHKGGGVVWGRYVRALRESIHVYPAEGGDVRADHVLTYFGATFLRLHYRMRCRAGMAQPNSASGVAGGK